MKQLIAASKTWRGVSWSILGGKILSLEPKNTLKEFKMLWNKHHEDSTDGKEGDKDLESITLHGRSQDFSKGGSH